MTKIFYFTAFIFCALNSCLNVQVNNNCEILNCITKFDTISNRQIYACVDNMPLYPGGEKEMLSFFINQINYPTEQCLNGKVYVSFIVEANGQVTNKRIKRGLSDLSDKESLNALDRMPKWSPGTCNGDAVAVEMVIPIDFTLH